jgi:hypothetical protein
LKKLLLGQGNCVLPSEPLVEIVNKKYFHDCTAGRKGGFS